jgi:hypothetical protein
VQRTVPTSEWAFRDFPRKIRLDRPGCTQRDRLKARLQTRIEDEDELGRADFLGAFAAVDEEEDGHADGEAVGDLFQYEGAAAVGDVAVDLNAAVDGAGVHDESVGFGEGEALAVEAVEADVFVEAGEHGLALAFVLDAQEVDDVGVGEGFLDLVGDAATHLFEDARDEGGGTAQGDAGAEFEEGPDVRAGDAAVEDVAEDGDVEAGDAAFLLEDGEGVEEGLGGVFVGAVAGVDDG